jgi:hypothetical protein
VNLRHKSLRERAEIIGRRIKGRWVCWRRGYHLDGGTIGHWDDMDRCRDCRAYKGLFTIPKNLGQKRPWGAQ